MHQVHFFRPVHDEFLLSKTYFFAAQFFYLSKNMRIQVLGKSLLHSSVANMAKVLQPFEITHGNTPSIQVHIRYTQNTFLRKNFVGFRRAGTIGSFTDDLCLYPGSIFAIDNILQCSGNQDITFQFKRIRVLCKVCGSGEIQNAAGFLTVLKYFFFI